MYQTIADIANELRRNTDLDAAGLDAILRRNSARVKDGRTRIAKKHILPYYLQVKESDNARWSAWDIDEELEQRLVALVRMKPRRTSSGVATITVITKPWPCSGDCVFCPNDIAMPKSYLRDEPACQRALRSCFDPYIQAATRLRTLELMGHTTDKVEMIVLGGTWLDYPREYRTWFASELYRALNEDGSAREAGIAQRRALYAAYRIPSTIDEVAHSSDSIQQRIEAGELSYNAAFHELYGKHSAWGRIAALQTATLDELSRQQVANEESAHRMVGLVFETRPDRIDATSLAEMRRMGCTKVQIGIQSTSDEALTGSARGHSTDCTRSAMRLLRLFGFKIHGHLMANLPGATPQSDRLGYAALITDAGLIPDEIKLYPCSLVKSARLMDAWRNGSWQPYSQEELIVLLTDDLQATPPYIRISRMVRDIGAQDIVIGCKKANLRQDVELEAARRAAPIREIRYRELAGQDAQIEGIKLEDIPYETDATSEHFLQWVDADQRIYGFLRLSLPHRDALSEMGTDAPVAPGEAMIREVHVYGVAEPLGKPGASAQHRGLGRALIERACIIAREAEYTRINVISAVGTRAYYRSLGFADGPLYQSKALDTTT